MTTREQILGSLQSLVASPKHVFIDYEMLKEKAKDFLKAQIPAWDNELQFIGTPEQTAQYYFFLDSINFCFWAPKGESRWAYKVGEEWISGYYAYSRAIKDAFVRDARFFDAAYLSTISEADFRNIFQGKNTLLLVEERMQIIRENFAILKEKFDGQAINIVREAKGDTDTFVQLILRNFPSFRDIVEKDGQQFCFLKRVQIFPSDLSFTRLEELTLSNLDHLTVFADYKLPQILESLGILRYSDELDSDIVNEKLIPAGSVKEMELRASSIVAIEQMREELVRLGRNITTNELDWILWVEAKAATFTKPHHKTLTTFY